MSNKPHIKLNEERELDFNFKNKEEFKVNVYICCDELDCWIGTLDKKIKEDLMKIAGPEHLQDSINCSLSEYELSHFQALLDRYDNKYTIGTEEYTMKSNS